jgi:diadenylate cyclase
MWKYTNKKWVIFSLTFFIGLFAVIVIADLKMAYRIYKYVLMFYFFVWALYFIPNIRNVFEGLTKPKNNKNFVINEEAQEELIKTLIDSVTYLSERQIGAIITIEKEDSLNTYISNGTTLDSLVTKELLLTIFMPGTALHDGAVISRENRIMCAGAFYPTSETGSIAKTYGSRHRAALGISEKCDAFTIVVSEETGNIAITFDGTLTEKVEYEGLKVFLKQHIIVK